MAYYCRNLLPSTQEHRRVEYGPPCLCLLVGTARVHQRRHSRVQVPSEHRTQHPPPCRPRRWWPHVAAGPSPQGWGAGGRFHPPESLHGCLLSAGSGSALPPPEKLQVYKMRPSISALHWHSPILLTVLLSHCKSLLINVKIKGQRPVTNGRKWRVEFEEKYPERVILLLRWW